MLKQEGARMICKDCKTNGINVEIHCKRVNDSYGERLSWRNPDGSSHFSYNEETKLYDHTPTVCSPVDVEIQDLKDRVAWLEEKFGKVWGE